MEIKIKFFQSFLKTPEDGETCLCYNKYKYFQVMVWNEKNLEFYDSEFDVHYPLLECPLWAYLPTDKCANFVKKHQ